VGDQVEGCGFIIDAAGCDCFEAPPVKRCKKHSLCADGQVRPHAQAPDIPLGQQADKPDFVVRPQLVETLYRVDEGTCNDVIDFVLLGVLEDIVNFIEFLIDITPVHAGVTLVFFQF
jgi:hypothetical protein